MTQVRLAVERKRSKVVSPRRQPLCDACSTKVDYDKLSYRSKIVPKANLGANDPGK